MSITGVSAVSSAAYFQQLQNTAPTNATGPATTAQTAAATLAAPTVQANATQQPEPVRHHHHHGGGEAAAPPSGLTQSGTAGAGGTSILNTVV